MRLKKKQRLYLLELVAEGLQTNEINERAEVFDPPFVVTRQLVDDYRKRYAPQLAEIVEREKLDALTTGLATRAERVKKLQQLAAAMEHDLFDNGLLWTSVPKTIGSGKTAKMIEIEEFNAAEVSAYRGVLEDIAREVGDRKANVNISGGIAIAAKVYAGFDPEKV